MTETETARRSIDAWSEGIDFEVRSMGDGLSFAGYAAVFNSWSADLGGYKEQIAPGAFTRSLNAVANGRWDVKMFLNHNDSIVLGSTKARTLRLTQDDRGLLAEATLPDNEWGRPVRDAVKRGEISSMSFGFVIDNPKSGQSYNDTRTERTIHDLRLFEVSPVTGWPAYAATSASVRALADAIDWTDEASARAVLDGLTEEQRDLLHRLLNSERPAPFIDPRKADLLARIAERAGQLAARGINLPD